MIKLHIFHTGTVGVDRAVPIREKNPLNKFGLFRSAKDRLKLPVSAYLIEHPKGKILIDTGWPEKYADQQPQWPLDKISTPKLTKEESVKSHLARLDLKPDDLDAIYLSHLDFDHTAGLSDLTDAKAFYTSKPEKEALKTHLLRYQKDTFDFVPLQTFEYEKSGIGPVGESYDVFKDGSVLLVHTPGHTNGLFTVMIKGKDGKYILLPGDAVYLQPSIRNKYLPGYAMSIPQARASVDWIHQCSLDPNCMLIAPNHDPSVQEQTIVLA